MINYMKNPGNSQGAVNKPPAASITSPANNANFVAGASVNIAANASDPDGSISKVEFYRGNTKVGEDATSPYTFQLTNVQPGTFAISVKAIDNQNGSTTSASINIVVKAANAAPAVKITAPTNNANYTAGATITIQSTATDTDGSITKVEFYSGPTKLGEDLTEPYSYTWSNPSAGTYNVTAKAFDNSGGQATSPAVTVVVNKPNSPPTISLVVPGNNASYVSGSTVNLNATVSDSDGTITKVEFFNGANKLGEDATAPFAFEWKNIPAGNFTITAKATDNDGATATSSPIKIQVSSPPNTPPIVKITTPADNATAVAGTTVSIAATASDADGSVAKVEFFNGANKLGDDATAPFAFEWKNIPAGNITITAKATDNDGATATSSPIKIQVSSPPNTPPIVNITTPADNATAVAGTTVSIAATASDADGSITKVEFFNEANKLGEDATAPFTFEWKNIPAGNFTITAKATDNDGAVAISTPVDISVASPNSPPTVKITAPVNGSSILSGTSVSITANAMDADGPVSKVEFFSGATKLGEDLTAPFSFSWSNASVGEHTLTVKATDNTSAVSSSAAVIVKVVAPASTTIAITSPVNNTVFNNDSEVVIEADVKTTYGKILKVEFFNGNLKLGEDLTSPYSYTWVDVSAGKHNITAKAHHEQNQVVTSSSVTIDIKQQAPPVQPEPGPSAIIADAGEDRQIGLPQNSATLTSGSTAVNASIVEHLWSQISGPQLAVIADATTSHATVADLQEGTYIFRLLVTDNFGNTASDEVVLEIFAPSVEEGIIPRYFTPNEDGINDTWEFTAHELLENALVTIFNRAGQTIYKGAAYQGAWDGTIEGQPLAPDAYFYVIRLADGRDLKGAVRIIR
jgi:gliding motility-associated-like protein